MDLKIAIRPTKDPMEWRRQRSLIKRKAINFTKIVSLVGIRHATDARNFFFRRVIWVIWLLFGTGFALYQIDERTRYYMRFPLRTEVQFITDQPVLRLPQVTICNEENVISEKNGIRQHLTTIRQNVEQMKKYEREGKAQERNDTEKSLQRNLDWLHNATLDWQTLSKEVAQTPEDAVVEVRFNHENIGSQLEKLTTDQGYCFAFGTKKYPLSSKKGGASNGLYLLLNTNSSEGFKILIHDPDEVPRMKEAAAGISLKSGTATRIAISFENVTFEGPPYYECNSSNTTYKTSNCLGVCDDQVFKERCKCRDIHMEGDGPVCSYGEILRCTKYYQSSYDVSSSNLSTCTCSHQCHSRIYKASVTQTRVKYSTEANRVYAYVYYPHITYMQVTNIRAYTLIELLCEIGGALSLLLGATLLTVYEASEFLVLFFKDYICYRFLK